MLPDSLWAAIDSTGENSEFYRGVTGVHSSLLCWNLSGLRTSLRLPFLPAY